METPDRLPSEFNVDSLVGEIDEHCLEEYQRSNDADDYEHKMEIECISDTLSVLKGLGMLPDSLELTDGEEVMLLSHNYLTEDADTPIHEFAFLAHRLSSELYLAGFHKYDDIDAHQKALTKELSSFLTLINPDTQPLTEWAEAYNRLLGNIDLLEEADYGSAERHMQVNMLYEMQKAQEDAEWRVTQKRRQVAAGFIELFSELFGEHDDLPSAATTFSWLAQYPKENPYRRISTPGLMKKIKALRIPEDKKDDIEHSVEWMIEKTYQEFFADEEPFVVEVRG